MVRTDLEPPSTGGAFRPGAGSRRSRLLLTTTIAVAVAGALTACGSSPPTSPSASVGGSAPRGDAAAAVAKAQVVVNRYRLAPTKIPVSTHLKSPAPRGKTVVALTIGNVPAAVKLFSGVKAAADAVGWNYIDVDYDQSNPATLQSALSTALIKHPTVVVLTGTDPNKLGASTVAAYRAAKVPLIALEQTGATSTGTVLVSNADASFGAQAEALAAWFVVDSKGTGKALVASVQGVAGLMNFSNSFVQDVHKLCSTCAAKIVPVPIASALGGQEPTTVVSALRSNSSYKYVFFDDGSFASGIDSAVAAAGLTGVKIGGQDFQPAQAEALRSHAEAVWTGENVVAIGYIAIDVALRHLEGMSIAQDSNAQGTQLMTASNIGTATDFGQPADALEQWKKLWKVQ